MTTQKLLGKQDFFVGGGGEGPEIFFAAPFTEDVPSEGFDDNIAYDDENYGEEDSQDEEDVEDFLASTWSSRLFLKT